MVIRTGRPLAELHDSLPKWNRRPELQSGAQDKWPGKLRLPAMCERDGWEGARRTADSVVLGWDRPEPRPLWHASVGYIPLSRCEGHGSKGTFAWTEARLV